jgi:transcriptional regulator with XRE-family HTH domain
VADRTQELGHPISRTAISEYETGKRKTMPVSDLVVIARALNVPPALLLYPGQPDAAIEYLPGKELCSIDAVQAFAGERSVVDETRESIALLRLARRWRALVADVAALEHAQSLAGDEDDEVMDNLLPGQSYTKRLENTRKERDEVRTAITKLMDPDA